MLGVTKGNFAVANDPSSQLKAIIKTETMGKEKGEKKRDVETYGARCSGQLDGMTSRQEKGGLFNVLLEII